MRRVFPSLEVHWGGSDGSRDLVVGYLEYNGQEWSFEYANGIEEASQIGFEGFRGLPKRPAGSTPTGSASLFPAFSARIPNLNRPDVVRTCGDLTSFPREEAFYEFLRRSGGRTGTDQIWFSEVTVGTMRASEGLSKPLRNEIRKMVTAIRGLLNEDICLQLEGAFRILRDGQILDAEAVSAERRDDREAIESAIRYEVASGRTPKEAVEQFTREVAFTYLNRLAAIKLMEARGLIQESVSRGPDSSGFRLFKRVCEEVCSAHPDGGFQRYLELLFDDVATEVRVLFDRTRPQSRLFPRSDVLANVLDVLNQSCPPEVWKSDETIGWIYQYFTPEEDRKALRDPRQGGSPSPRNSYELAVRNQFYTPRYVVEFLTDNTLGRMWYEMCNAQTRLTSVCKYLVRRPNEIFLAPGQSRPEVAPASKGSQTELAQQAVYVQHRPSKDPRDIRILDPACGSAHFLLYAFDLLLIIYEEAWNDPGVPPFTETGTSLRLDFPDLETLRRELPSLILRHNLHGIDIDLRATQIAALALWLRAQRAYQELGLKPYERPRILRSNIVCAEPMPGDKALLNEFLTQLQPPVLRQLVRAVFEKMELAGDAGSLLKIEEQIVGAVSEAKRQWAEGTKAEQMLLWPETRRSKTEQAVLFDTTGITEESFWHDAEDRVLEELQKYALHAENGWKVVRSLFSGDAAQGFAFVDVCRKRFDVVLMNPPFGEFSKKYKDESKLAYPNTYNDIFGAFIERFLSRLQPSGLLGAITSRAGFFLTTFFRWRKEVLLKQCALRSLADLGLDVMDEAMVEAAAYCLERSEPAPSAIFFRLLGLQDRESALLRAVNAVSASRNDPVAMFVDQRQFEILDDVPFVYWISSRILRLLASLPRFEPAAGKVRQGLVTGDNPRFVRALWEIPNSTITGGADIAAAYQEGDSALRTAILHQLNGNRRWVPHVIAGPSQPWYSPLTLAVNWHKDGAELRNFKNAKGKLRSRPQNTDYYFRPGFSWTRRAVRFIPYAVPAGCIPTASRYMAFPKVGTEFAALGVCASNVATAFLRFYGERFNHPNYLVENVKKLPWPSPSEELKNLLEQLAKQEVENRRHVYQMHEPFHEFTAPPEWPSSMDDKSLVFDKTSLLGPKLETSVAAAFGLSSEDLQKLERDLNEALHAQAPATDQQDGDTEEDNRDFVLPTSAHSRAEAWMSYAVGCAFGRWDVRIGSDPSLAPRFPEPFEPLSRCAPGTLLAPDGLPAESGRIVSEDWLRARPNANTFPPEGSVRNPTITDEDYPLSNLPWDGILVDDDGHHADIVSRVSEVFHVLLGNRADEIQREFCDVLGVKEIRSYFRNPKKFFEDHIKRYSKSTRKAPIYWLLQSSRRSYGIWVYYHRITHDTLFHMLRAYIEPKIEHEQARSVELRRLYEAAKRDKAGTDERKLAKDVDSQETLVAELLEFKSKIEAVAYGRLSGVEPGCPGWDPDLNDGVILNIAPLYSVVPWNEVTKTWRELADAHYDWSHVAMRFWPHRTEEKCRKDRSIAIAHGLEAN